MTNAARPQLPPGQQLAAPGKWPLVGERTPAARDDEWTVSVVGCVETPCAFDMKALKSLPRRERTIDIHCVTRWSKLAMPFAGVDLADVLACAMPTGEALYVSFVARSERGHSTSLVLEDALKLNALVALEVEHRPLTVEHGGPARLVVPGRYFYKSLKWLECIELLAADRLGYWEGEAGYHNVADPWREERYLAPDLTRQEMRRVLEVRDFAGHNLRSLQARGHDLAGLNARGAVLRDADFRDCLLAHACFDGTNLANARFGGADLRRATFVGADLEGADLLAPTCAGLIYAARRCLAPRSVRLAKRHSSVRAPCSTPTRGPMPHPSSSSPRPKPASSSGIPSLAATGNVTLKHSGLFITGTDTGVGKTYVAAMIVRDLAAAGLRVGVYKPVASGCRLEGDRLVSDDALALWNAAGRPGTLDAVCPQCFAAPLAPHLAARAEGRQVDAARLRSGLDYWRNRSDVVVVEGVGGLLSPVSEDQYVADLASDFGLPLIVVAANRLGTIHQTLATLVVAATFREGLDVAGVILNRPSAAPGDESIESNYDELCRRSVPPVLAQLAWQATSFNPPVDWLTKAPDTYWASPWER